MTIYRLIKLPGRVALIVRQLHRLDEVVAQIGALNSRIDGVVLQVTSAHTSSEAAVAAVESLQSEVRRTAAAAEAGTKRLESRIKDTADVAARVSAGLHEESRLLTGLHEKSDRNQIELRTRLASIQPVLHAGNNLVIARVDESIMAFPAEEWRLPAYEILAGRLEPGLLKAIRQRLEDDMTFVDIGANVGTYTLAALKGIGSGGKVISFEPTPRVFDILRNNVQVNGFLESGRVDLRRKALADEQNARRPFHVPGESLTHSSLFGDGGEGSSQVIEVETATLDDELADFDRVDMVKIDAEGAEPMILRGMRKIIARSPRISIFMEFAPQYLVRAGVDPIAFLDEIRAMRFDIFEVVEPSGEIRTAADDYLARCFSSNLLLVRSARQ